MSEVRDDQAPPPPRTRRVLVSGRRNVQRAGTVVRGPGVGSLAAVAVLALVVGVVLGRQATSGDGDELRRAVETQVLPLALDADNIWTSSLGGRPSVSTALVALQRNGDAEQVLTSLDAWLDAYDAVIREIAAVELASQARPVQRQYVNGVTLSRDAVEVLGQSALTDDPDRRRGLLVEVGRLRGRAEQLIQAARASTADLGGGANPVTPLGDLPPFPDRGSTEDR